MKCPYCKHELTAKDQKRICKNVQSQKHGSAGGTVRATKLSANRRKEIAQQAAAKRWKKDESK